MSLGYLLSKRKGWACRGSNAPQRGGMSISFTRAHDMFEQSASMLREVHVLPVGGQAVTREGTFTPTWAA